MQDTTRPTSPPPPPPTPPPPRVLRRRDGHLGGVAAGVGHYLDLDANLVRVGFVVLSLLGGTGVFLYLAGWILIPTADEDPSSQPVTLRTDSATAVLGAVVLALAALVLLGPFDGDGGLLLPLVLVGLGVWLLSQRPNTAPRPAGSAPGTGGAGGAPSAGWAGGAPGAGWAGGAPEAGGSGADRVPVPWQPATPDRQPAAVPVPVDSWPRSSTDLEHHPAAADAGPGHLGWEPEPDLGDASADPSHPGPGGTPPPPPPPGGSAHGWAIPHGPDGPVRPAPAGPPVTSITLAVLAITIGVLLVLDSVDAIDLTVVAVAATSLAVIGCGLLAGAFLGRARGLVPLGLLALLGLAVAPAADFAVEGGVADRVVQVDDEAALQDQYRVGIGSLLVDLRDLEPEALDRELEVTVGIGVVEVIVPDGVRVEVEGRSGAGYVELFGREDEGLGAELRTADGSAGEEVLVLDANARIGAVIVRRG